MTAGTPTLHAEIAAGLRRRRAILLSLVAESEADLALFVEPPEEADDARSAARPGLGRLLARLDRGARRELAAIDAALHRLRSGGYGDCHHCRQPIAVPRLRAVPTADRCAPCAEVHGSPDDDPRPEVPAPTHHAHGRAGLVGPARPHRPRRHPALGDKAVGGTWPGLSPAAPSLRARSSQRSPG